MKLDPICWKTDHTDGDGFTIGIPKAKGSYFRIPGNTVEEWFIIRRGEIRFTV